jgi:hypothetical protein
MPSLNLGSEERLARITQVFSGCKKVLQRNNKTNFSEAEQSIYLTASLWWQSVDDR